MSITAVSGFAHLTDLPCYELRCGKAKAVISPYGAQLLSYQPRATIEMLYLSNKASWKNNTAIRGGVPVCWPWFGPVPAELNSLQQKQPNHGVVRTEFWQLVQQSITEEAVSVEFRINTSALPYANAPSHLTLTLTLTESELTLALHSNQGVQQAALHSYFAVESVHQVTVSDLTGCYLDKVRANEKCKQTQPELKFNAETDRIYLNTPAALRLQSGKTSIGIAQQGHDASVLWNPWSEKSVSLSDLDDLAYLDFVCVETARLSLANTAPLQLVQQLRYDGQLA